MKSAVIFENQHYTACAMRDGSLIVQHKRKRHGRQGVQLVPAIAGKWIDAIKAADDATEASAYCRVILAQ